MRPSAEGEDGAVRSRKSSTSDGKASARPKTFFLTRDPDQVPPSKSTKVSQILESQSSPSKREQLEAASRQSKSMRARHVTQETSLNARRRSTIKPHITVDIGSRAMPEQPPRSRPSSNTSLTRSFQSSPMSTSPPGTGHEQIDEATISQAVMSSDEEADFEMDDSAPQLIMPSIKMPSRRPFTQQGRQLGRLKILVTGSQGSGRTSLIKSIVQLCEHIVHVDTISSSVASSDNMNNRQFSIIETYASTKPYPEWWSDVDDSRILKRRKSLGNLVLERNICFVDTIGSGHVDNTLAYIEQQFFHSITSINRPGSELRNLLSGRGGSQVDLVLYLVTTADLKVDLERIKKISQLTNVVPLIAKADLLSEDQVATFKSSVSSLDHAIARLPMFGKDNHESYLTPPYSVSSANGPDFDTMDASLLMSPEYVQPLSPSDLAILVDQIFDPGVSDYLRHASGKKLVAWYSTNPRLTKPTSPSLKSFQPSTLDSPVQNSLTHSGVLQAVASEVSLNTSNSFALAKVADHGQREEHLAQIRLCKWASELQLSLQRERERYESIAQNERALWLVQKMGEEIRDGQIVPMQPHGTRGHTLVNGKVPAVYYVSSGKYEVYDPLGLLRWQDVVRARGWVMLQVLGSFGVIGGVTVWLAKTFGWTNSLHQWAQDLGVSWYGKEQLVAPS